MGEPYAHRGVVVGRDVALNEVRHPPADDPRSRLNGLQYRVGWLLNLVAPNINPSHTRISLGLTLVLPSGDSWACASGLRPLAIALFATLDGRAYGFHGAFECGCGVEYPILRQSGVLVGMGIV